MTTIYIAGPWIFRADADTWKTAVQDTATRLGLTLLLPKDAGIHGLDIPPREAANTIAALDYACIDAADIVIAEISPWRGPNMDPGTAAEVGYAFAKQVPIILWTNTHASLRERTMEQGYMLDRGKTTDLDGHTIESLGLEENLMIAAPMVHHGPILRSITHALEIAARLAAGVD